MKYAINKEIEGGDDENGPKRRQTRRLGHRYVTFLSYSHFLMFYCIYNLRNTRWIKRWKAETTKTGLNDASGIV